MVRHEAAEAMGATPLVQSVPTLKDFLVDERREVRETCEIASSGTIWKKARQKRRNLKRRTRGSTSIRLLPLLVDLFLFCRQFISEDPAPALPSSLLRPSSRSSTSYIDADVSSLTKNPLRSVSFPVRQIPGPFYLAKYISTPAAIDALSSALLSPNEICSPLFNPEVAFVFGQMSDPHSVPALIKVLEDE